MLGRSMRTLFLIVVFLPLLNGCVIPWSANVPSVVGRVVDADSGNPLVGVSVIRQPRRRETATKVDGTFLLQPAFDFKFQWIVPPVACFQAFTNRVEFTAHGYESRIITNVSVKGNSVPTDLQTIELKRLTTERPNQSVEANCRPAGQSDGSDNLAAIVAADRAATRDN